MDGPERIAHAFAAAKGRAALMPYLMGGFPDVPTSLAIGEAYVDGGADLIELGVPFSDPLADGPVVHAAGTKALENGTTVDGRPRRLRAALRARPDHHDDVREPRAGAQGPGGLRPADRRAGASGLIVPDLPLEESGAVLEACDAAGVALVPLVAPTTPDDRMARIGARARGFVYTVSVVGTTGERAALSDTFGSLVARAKAAHRRPRRARLRHRQRPSRSPRPRPSGADGVIVGSRLVRAAAEADDPAAAVRELVERVLRARRVAERCAMAVLHVTNGTAAAARPPRASARSSPGTTSCTRARCPPSRRTALRETRARFLADAGLADLATARARLAARDARLDAVDFSTKLVLWFEDDLYDQLQLIQILDRLATGERRPRAARRPLGPVQLVRLPRGPRTFLRDRLARAASLREPDHALRRRAWAAFTAPDPRAVEDDRARLAGARRTCPDVAPALAAPAGGAPGDHRRPQPAPSARSSRRSRPGPLAPAGAVRRATSAREERPFHGDATLWWRADRLAPALLDRDADGAFALTDDGARVLAGEADAADAARAAGPLGRRRPPPRRARRPLRPGDTPSRAPRRDRIRPDMGLAYSITASLCLWLVLWALGAKALDSFLLAALLMIIAVTVHTLSKYNPAKRTALRRRAPTRRPALRTRSRVSTSAHAGRFRRFCTHRTVVNPHFHLVVWRGDHCAASVTLFRLALSPESIP